jgi:8-oxo-dGTP pyrophosphatase MutT (NUDIX family)
MTAPLKSSTLVITKLVKDLARNNNFDYKILHVKRSGNVKWANVLAYPGGKIEKEDFYQFHRIINPQEQNKEAIDYNIAKLAALRETYEEVGLFFAKPGTVNSETLALTEQLFKSYSAVGKAPLFYDLQNIFYPIENYNIHEVFRLVTIPQLKHRFNTQFFITIADENCLNFHSRYVDKDSKGLYDYDNLNVEANEHTEHHWLNPVEVLKKYYNKEIELAPPQFMISNVLLSFKKIGDFLTELKQIKQQSDPTSTDYLKRNPLTFPLMIGMTQHSSPEFKTKGYSHAGKFPCDGKYALDFYLKLESNEEWKNEIKEKFGSLQKDQSTRARFYFSDPKSMFEKDYDVEFKMDIKIPHFFMRNRAAVLKEIESN